FSAANPEGRRAPAGSGRGRQGSSARSSAVRCSDSRKTKAIRWEFSTINLL
ncbi:helicase associated domain (ha2) protein, partial [Toxoplasma gondii ARI]